jgi:DNA invertase Pin-like site-specific DNA recombinase
MFYGYISTNTDPQSDALQRLELEQFCLKNKIQIEQWVEEKTNGAKSPNKHLGQLLATAKKDDVIICCELSCLGGSISVLLQIINQLMISGAEVWTIKDNYRLGDNIQSKALAQALGLSAEIERSLISQRTKSGLARKRAEGVTLGRPQGRKPDRLKLSGHEKEIQALLEKRTPKTAIARKFGVSRLTVDSFIKDRMQKN